MEFSDIEKEYLNFIKRLNLEPQGLESVKVITDTAADLKLEFLSLQPLPLKKVTLISSQEKTSQELLQKKGLQSFIWEVPLSIKMKADFANLLDFLKRIEEGKRFMRIDTIRITKDTANPFVHNVSLVVSMYSLPVKEEAK